MHVVTRRSASIWVAVAASLLIALLALAPGALGVAHGQTAGPPPTPTPSAPGTPTPTTASIPPTGGTVASPTGKITITIPSQGRPLLISVQPVVPPSTSTRQQQIIQQTLQSLGIPQPSNANGTPATVAELFALDASFADTGSEVGTFTNTVSISVDVSPETLLLAGGNLANLTLAFFDENTGTWVPVSCAPSGNGIACDLTHFSLWALIVTSAPVAGAPPAAGAPAPSTAPVPAATGFGPGESAGRSLNAGMLAVAAVALLTMAGAGATVVTRRRRS